MKSPMVWLLELVCGGRRGRREEGGTEAGRQGGRHEYTDSYVKGQDLCPQQVVRNSSQSYCGGTFKHSSSLEGLVVCRVDRSRIFG